MEEMAILYQPQHVIYFYIWFKLHKMKKISIPIGKTDTIYSLIAYVAISESSSIKQLWPEFYSENWLSSTS